jgi:hypothetical protein
MISLSDEVGAPMIGGSRAIEVTRDVTLVDREDCGRREIEMNVRRATVSEGAD